VIHRPVHISAFEFVILSAHRTAQLMRGCTPRVKVAEKATVTAQLEIAEGKVLRAPDLPRR
jgi:DNA-directed RNA polymerase subunit K/omega